MRAGSSGKLAGHLMRRTKGSSGADCPNRTDDLPLFTCLSLEGRQGDQLAYARYSLPASNSGFAFAGLLLVPALAARIPGHSADFVVRVWTKGGRGTLVGVARIAALGPVADALVALALRIPVAAGCLAAGDSNAG